MRYRTLFSVVLLLIVAVCLSACSPDNPNPSSTAESVDLTCDVLSYANISSDKLVELLGEPTSTESASPASGFVDIPCLYYNYDDVPALGEVSFILINNKVSKFISYNDYPYYDEESLLFSSLNASNSDSCTKIADTGEALRYRCVNDTIDDLWISNIEGDSFGFLSVTYDMLYFEEWYLPMSTSEESDYMYWTKEAIKRVLHSPKSADFPNIFDWQFGKNKYYVALRSYVDAQNLLGVVIRNEFLFIYKAGTNTPVYAVLGDEVLLDDGYIPTAELIKLLVDEPLSNSVSSSNSSSSTPATNNDNPYSFPTGSCLPSGDSEYDEIAYRLAEQEFLSNLPTLDGYYDDEYYDDGYYDDEYYDDGYYDDEYYDDEYCDDEYYDDSEGFVTQIPDDLYEELLEAANGGYGND